MEKNKIIFLICSSEPGKCDLLSSWVKKKFEGAVIFLAPDYLECFQKMRNAPPTVLITDFVLAKSKPGQVLERVIAESEFKNIPIVVIGGNSKRSDYVDAIVVGKAQFVEKLDEEADLSPFLNRAMNYANSTAPTQYKVRYLNVGDILIREGDQAAQVFLLKKGHLRAYQVIDSDKVVLGEIFPGEFVGEMAFLNNENRIATVDALSESEVVEIPIEIFDKVIYQKATWSKILLETLSKRLKATAQK